MDKPLRKETFLIGFWYLQDPIYLIYTAYLTYTNK